MGLLKTAIGVGVTLVIGGTAYTINHADVVNNFSKDTGLSQQQSEEYINNVNKEDLISYDKVGNTFIKDGRDITAVASKIDCANYTYEWVTTLLSCQTGKSQLIEAGNDEIALGYDYIKLSTDSASKGDISSTISAIDKVNSDYDFAIISKLLNDSTVSSNKKANSYNKATLQAALQNN